MKVWFCRDDSGECSVWKHNAEPVKYTDRTWDLESSGLKYLLSDGTADTEAMFGKGFHGVRKGAKKLIDIVKA